VEKERLHAYTKQCAESHVNIYMYIFLLQIIIHIQAVTEKNEFGWVMEGNVCAEDYTFLRKNKLSFKDRIFVNHSTILAVNTVQLVSDMMSHTAMKGCR
jgi:hypothetical protein